MPNTLPLLPPGSSSFPALRQGKGLYVDKTELIRRLAGSGRGKILLTRPPRFGKSLLVSTFESLFRHGLRDFRGLAIEPHWTDTTYDVVRLDFSSLCGFTTFAEFQRMFDAHLIRRFSPLGFAFQPESFSLKAQLSDWLRKRDPISLVVLVDDYDAPLTAALKDKDLFTRVQNRMDSFFLTLKEAEGCLRFLFVTGLTKLSVHDGLLGLNYLDDISLSRTYGTLLGYSLEEVERAFSGHLQNAERILGMTHEELLDAVRERCGGYAFDRRGETHVCNPWSVLNFLLKPQDGLLNDRLESGGRAATLIRYLRENGMLPPETLEADSLIATCELAAAQEVGSVSPEALLVQAGYLTIREETAPGVVRIGCPNGEAAAALSRHFADETHRTVTRERVD